jgi:dienelactone hydrolase
VPDLGQQLPSSLRAQARWERVGPDRVPAVLIHPDWTSAAPVTVWIHGRTVNKELDPGRYLRWMRAGVAACALDLPGHGERFDAGRQDAAAAFGVLTQMIEEIDGVVEALPRHGPFDPARIAIGGMSLGGMAALGRLTRTHPFTCATVEATTGNWAKAGDRARFTERVAERTRAWEPITHLDGWREVPLLAIHARHDEWVSFDEQAAFIDALRGRYRRPDLIEFVAYDRTGAPHEHIGFGRMSNDAKQRQAAFLAKNLTPSPAV